MLPAAREIILDILGPGEIFGDLEMRLEDLVFQPLSGRLAFALPWQTQRHGVTEADGSVRRPLSQKDLAYLIGASREAVAEQLAVMKRQGLLKTSYRTIHLLDQVGWKKILAKNSYESAAA